MSRRIRFVLVALVLVVIVAVCWFMVLSPLRADIATANASIEAERTKLAAAQAKLAQAETTRQEGKLNQARLLELAKMVPDSEEIPSLLLQIQELADQSGIEFISITPGEPVEAGAFQIIPLQLEFSGTYFDLSDFVYRAEQMAAGPGRLLAVKALALRLASEATTESVSDTSQSPVLGVSMTLYAFETAVSAAATPATTPGATPPATSAGTASNESAPTANPSGL
jgi:type IV pilus assembly protein PilO